MNNVRLSQCGQDLVEYALMAGFIAVAALAIIPGVATTITTLFAKCGWVFDPSTARLVGAALAVVFLGVIVLRREENT